MLSKFAQRQMKLTGWEEGKGLGKNENGMKEALKVKIKADNAGVGHDPGEQFSFHWWEHVFAKSAKNIKVEENESGVVLKTEGDTVITTKKKTPKTSMKNALYGNFVKSGTLENGKVTKEEESESSSDSDSDSDKGDKKFAVLTDEQLLEACGGRTAHKGARHGVTLSAKLERLEKQESFVMEEEKKVRKKKKKRKTEREATEQNSDGIQAKKHSNNSVNEVECKMTSKEILTKSKKSKKNKKNKEKGDEKTKLKKKKRKNDQNSVDKISEKKKKTE